jgi:hypothetical protein
MADADRLDNLIVIIGAMKSGTTSLHSYLNSHPSISMSRWKELEFFVRESNWKKGLKWYTSQLPGDTRWTGEASTSYTKYPQYQGVAERMASVAPKAKLIYIVRHPIKRIVSSYIHGVAKGWEQQSIDEALGNPEKNIHVMPSCYHLQLTQYLPHYDQSQIFVSSLERMGADRVNMVREVFRFLGVDEDQWDPTFEARENTSDGRTQPTPFTRAIMRFPAGRQLRGAIRRFVEPPISAPKMSDTTRQRLIDFIGNDISKFKAQTGMSFDEWAPDF